LLFTWKEKDFVAHETGSLVEMRVHPFHYKNHDASCQQIVSPVYSNTVLIGDAAHAMVPFMGQGTNAAFEDIVVLLELLDECNGNLTLALPAFTQARKPHVDALSDMANDHDRALAGMHHPPPASEYLRKYLSSHVFPGVTMFKSAYERVAFSTAPYGTCIASARVRRARRTHGTRTAHARRTHTRNTHKRHAHTCA
jgi:kynurenine 3-monooxygenase